MTMLLIVVLIALGILLYVEFFVRKKSDQKRNVEWVDEMVARYNKITSEDDVDKDDLLDLRYEIQHDCEKHTDFDPELATLVLNLLIKIDRKLDKLSV